MFRCSLKQFKRTKSTIVRKERDRLSGSKMGRDYNFAYRSFGPFGYGVGKNQSKKDRAAEILPRYNGPSISNPGPMSKISRTLSNEWVPHALHDGGVLFLHPSTNQVLRWSQKALKEERESVGLYSAVDHDRDVKIKTLLARNTIEAQPIEQWRKKHITQLLRHNMKMK